ncbi:MAG: hypothetical protein KAS11_00340 [Candidatus Aenigmarchaeota archaeon]|nr:hypothetical protein [Candidatus Aenigmarchaeota archaeon]
MFEKIETEYLIIETESNDLFPDIIASMPIKPAYLNINALAYGIPYCGTSEEDINAYLKQCNNKRVLPFSKTEWSFSDSKKTFTSNGISIEDFSRYIPEDADRLYRKIAKKIRHEQLAGKKPHRLTIELGAPIKGGFNELQKEICKPIFKNYQIENGRLWLTADYSKGYSDDGPREISTMIFSKKDSNNILELFLRENDDDLKREILMEWFSELKSNYDIKSTK